VHEEMFFHQHQFFISKVGKGRKDSSDVAVKETTTKFSPPDETPA